MRLPSYIIDHTEPAAQLIFSLITRKTCRLTTLSYRFLPFSNKTLEAEPAGAGWGHVSDN